MPAPANAITPYATTMTVSYWRRNEDLPPTLGNVYVSALQSKYISYASQPVHGDGGKDNIFIYMGLENEGEKRSETWGGKNRRMTFF